MRPMHFWLILGLGLCAACTGAQQNQSSSLRATRDAGPLLGAPSALSNFDGRDALTATGDAATGDAR